MKKVLSALIVAVMLIGMLPAIAIPAFAEVTSGTTGDCTWTLNGTELTISGAGAMKDYSSGDRPWGTTITKVSIKDGVTSIGDYAFIDCSQLISITIPDSVITIGKCAFCACSGLISVTIPDSVTAIGDDAFTCCFGLTSITIPDSVTTIGKYAFDNCDEVTSLKIGNGITTIREGTFAFCNALTTIIIPDSVVTIEKNAFEGCYALSSLFLGKNVSRIESKVFRFPLNDVWYCGTESQKNMIDIDSSNHGLLSVTWHYFNEFIYNNEATALKNSAKTAICSLCGAKQTVTAAGTKLQIPFKDVELDKYYAEPVLWAVEKGVTNGMTANTFAPNNECTRGQIVTFLWRAAGSPEPASTRNPFVDVKSNQYYYKAVLWAVEKGITNGTSTTTFSPDATCTRAQVVTFLWRAKGSPKVSAANPFKDVKKSYYSDAVLWAVKNNITTGTSATTFSPDATCTRGQIVTFLYRAYK